MTTLEPRDREQAKATLLRRAKFHLIEADAAYLRGDGEDERNHTNAQEDIATELATLLGIEHAAAMEQVLLTLDDDTIQPLGPSRDR